MTSPKAVEGAILAIREYSSHIFVGDADSGGYNRFSMNQVYQSTGIGKFAKEHGVQLVNLSEGPRRTVKLDLPGKEVSLDLPVLLLDEMDTLVTMPVPKLHCNTQVSLSFKNQWGCIPEPRDRLKLHPRFAEVIFEVNRAVKTRTVLMDGKYGLNDNGPMRGRPVELNWILASNDPGAAARVACHLMQVDPGSVEHLEYVRSRGELPNLEEIKMNTEFSSFIGERFKLYREPMDYPGVLAFRYSPIAYLAYFSPLADFLHKVLYLFRKPFYDYDSPDETSDNDPPK